jgi:hypothetical protein
MTVITVADLVRLLSSCKPGASVMLATERGLIDLVAVEEDDDGEEDYCVLKGSKSWD